MFEKEKQEIIECGIMMDRYDLIALAGGNVSLRVSDDLFLITPSGIVYEKMKPEEVLVVDKRGKVIEGSTKPSTDMMAWLYVYEKMPHINAIIHTHQPYTTAIGLVEETFPCILTTLGNTAKGHIPVAPYAKVGTEELGYSVVDNIGDSLVVILKQHGIVSVGKDLKEALYACIYSEEAAKTYIAAKTMSADVPTLDEEQIADAVQVFSTYGQASK